MAFPENAGVVTDLWVEFDMRNLEEGRNLEGEQGKLMLEPRESKTMEASRGFEHDTSLLMNLRSGSGFGITCDAMNMLKTAQVRLISFASVDNIYLCQWVLLSMTNLSSLQIRSYILSHF